MTDNKDPKYNRKAGDTLEGWQVFAIGCIVGAIGYAFIFDWVFDLLS